MNEQLEQTPQIETVTQAPSLPVELSVRSPQAVWKRKSRATKIKRYSAGMVTKAGTLISWRSSFNPLDRHLIAKFTCSQSTCLRVAESRMDKFLDINRSCGCLKDENVGRMIETIISAVPENIQESIAKELELGKRSPYSIGELAVHFQLFGSLARCAMTRMRKRWAESEWIRLGERRMEAIRRSVQKVGVTVTAKRFFQQTCTILVACRFVRTYSPSLGNQTMPADLSYFLNRQTA